MPTIVTDALTTLARAKTFLGLSSDSYDSVLTMLINMATSVIKQYTGRDIKSQTYTNQELDGSGSKEIVLKQWPVTAFSTLQYRSVADGSDQWTTIDSDDYYWYEDGRIVFVAGKFTEAPQHYRATYTAGYLIDFDNEANTSLHTLPFELEMVCLKLVSLGYNTRRADGLVTSKVGDITLQYKANIMSDDTLKTVLDKYSKINV